MRPARHLVTRLSPTPSGYLHLGNAANLLLASWWARGTGGRLLLRIDDFDADRTRPEYLDDVFDTLAWLGIRADAGPTDAADFARHWSMGQHSARLRAEALRLLAAHPADVFVCRCSRRELTFDGFCHRDCRTAAHPLVEGVSALRLRVPVGRTVQPTAPGPGAAGIPAGPWTVPAGDHVLWRRDGHPAYQLGSVLADEALGVNAVVRGADLLESSALQLHLADLLPAPGFRGADLRHHPLLTNPDGSKLSKSAGLHAAPMARTDALLDRVRRRAAALGELVGISPA